MTYEVVMPYHLHMPSYFLGTFTEYPFVEFAVRDYNKPMGVATYRASKDMPERLRNALPDIEELKKLL